MKKSNHKLKSLQLNKVKICQMVFGGITDPTLDEDGEKEVPITLRHVCNDSNADCQATNVRACNPR